MTDKQKKQIRAMRMQGFGYCAIAKELGLKENNVQSFCKYNGLSGDPSLISVNYMIWCEQHNRCLTCGIRLTQPRTGRRKKFCSGRCRTRYCRENKT